MSLYLSRDFNVIGILAEDTELELPCFLHLCEETIESSFAFRPLFYQYQRILQVSRRHENGSSSCSTLSRSRSCCPTSRCRSVPFIPPGLCLSGRSLFLSWLSVYKYKSTNTNISSSSASNEASEDLRCLIDMVDSHKLSIGVFQRFSVSGRC